MALVAAALLPNSPLLLPGRDAVTRAAASKTHAGLARLAGVLNTVAPDILLVVAVGGETTSLPTRYALLQSPRLAYEFSEFGEFITSGVRTIASGLTHHLREVSETKFPLPLVAPAQLPYTFAVPLVCLGQAFAEKPAVFLQVPRTMPLDELRLLGQLLADTLAQRHERIAVLGAGSLAVHSNGSGPDAKVFDQQLQAALVTGTIEPLINLDPALRKRAVESLWAPAAISYAILADHNLGVSLLSYEVPFGVGYIVGYLDLN